MTEERKHRYVDKYTNEEIEERAKYGNVKDNINVFRASINADIMKRMKLNNELGNCYADSYLTFVKLYNGQKHLKRVRGRRVLEKLSKDDVPPRHYWVEIGDIVYDISPQTQIVCNKELYYFNMEGIEEVEYGNEFGAFPNEIERGKKGMKYVFKVWNKCDSINKKKLFLKNFCDLYFKENNLPPPKYNN
jgi:hypothetical protein